VKYNQIVAEAATYTTHNRRTSMPNSQYQQSSCHLSKQPPASTWWSIRNGIPIGLPPMSDPGTIF